MAGWGPNLVNVAVRRLVPAEVHNVGFYGRAPLCVASIASRLHEQTFVKAEDGKQTVAQYAASKGMKLKKFIHWELGRD